MGRFRSDRRVALVSSSPELSKKSACSLMSEKCVIGRSTERHASVRHPSLSRFSLSPSFLFASPIKPPSYFGTESRRRSLVDAGVYCVWRECCLQVRALADQAWVKATAKAMAVADLGTMIVVPGGDDVSRLL